MKPIVYIIVFLVTILLLFTGKSLFYGYILGSLKYEIVSQILSPDSRSKVIVFDCSVANGGYTGISILPDSSRMSYNNLKREEIYSTQSAVHISTQWISENQLLVTIHGKNELEIRRQTIFRGISIKYCQN